MHNPSLLDVGRSISNGFCFTFTRL